MSPLFTRLGTLRETRAWRTAAYLLGGALLCELAARISFIAPDGHALGTWFERGEAGPLLRLYDKLAGFGVSRGTAAALGLMPYLSARILTWIARSVSPALDARWSVDAGRTERTRWTRGLTLGLSLIQSYGYARFTQTIPGVVAQPGPQYIAETMLVQTAVAMFLMWIGEQVTEPADQEAPARHPDELTVDHALPGHDARSFVLATEGSAPVSSKQVLR